MVADQVVDDQVEATVACLVVEEALEVAHLEVALLEVDRSEEALVVGVVVEEGEDAAVVEVDRLFKV